MHLSCDDQEYLAKTQGGHVVLLLEDEFMIEDRFSSAALSCSCLRVHNIIAFVMISNEMHATNGKLILQTGCAHLLVHKIILFQLSTS